MYCYNRKHTACLEKVISPSGMCMRSFNFITEGGIKGAVNQSL